MTRDYAVENVKKVLSKAMTDVFEKLDITVMGVGWSLRTRDDYVIVEKDFIGGSGVSLPGRAECLDFADIFVRQLYMYLCAKGNVLSRQSGEQPGAIVTDHYIFSIYGQHSPALADETICLVAAVRLGWITLTKAIEMAKITDDNHPDGNTVFLGNNWNLHDL
ncbi:TPA: hypothetical protein DD449_01570 [Candidatus Berkelbacteria bacterium]|uniref:Uncharacterized protein n=1 Tax=Berkelbacteria bacterium GW2011_GWE1_39_12 TaxID=1618337 RepID=A0A0G4B6B2_9BACT|nr:MAG: hypothetical protein UT28_C0001G0772 [Berkelbacteria bacterium GW2011_GWE1_39_12]HBO60359.1 hypothetical protein [Candidatus Berkelbacteria bacterium]